MTALVTPLNAAQSRVLTVIAAGGKMESRRTYPYPRKFLLFSKDGHEYAAKVPEGTVATLLEMQLVQAVQLDATGDRIAYYATTLGVRAVQKHSALPAADDSQLDLLGDTQNQAAVA